MKNKSKHSNTGNFKPIFSKLSSNAASSAVIAVLQWLKHLQTALKNKLDLLSAKSYFSLLLIFQRKCQLVQLFLKATISSQEQNILPMEKGKIIRLQFYIPFGKHGAPLWFDRLLQYEIILNSKKVTSSAMM